MARAKTSENGGTRNKKSKAAAAGASAGGGNGNGRSWSGDLQEQIRVRAYELYVQRGGSPGSEKDDWIAAEREVLGPGQAH